MPYVVAISSRGISEAGRLTGVAGALVIAVGAVSFLRANAMGRKQNRTLERQATAAGASLLALGLVVAFVGMLAK